MNEPPPRRRFQFRLRALLIVVTIIALVCGWQAKNIRDRREAAKTYRTISVLPSAGPDGAVRAETRKAPWPLCWLGEDGYFIVIVPLNTPINEMQRLVRLFPEARIGRLGIRAEDRSAPLNHPAE
jgi:hypothetical protein